MIILSILFFITAILYSSVGFGGGSTYLALLLIWDLPYYIFPIIALICNIIVVTGNSFNYIRAGNYNFKLLTPFLLGSIPFAFIGGTLVINKDLFEILLFFVLTLAGLLLFLNNKSYEKRLHFSLLRGPKNMIIFNNIFEKLIINEKIDKTLFSLMCASQFTRLLPFRIKSKDFHNAKYFYSLASHILK